MEFEQVNAGWFGTMFFSKMCTDHRKYLSLLLYVETYESIKQIDVIGKIKVFVTESFLY